MRVRTKALAFFCLVAVATAQSASAAPQGVGVTPESGFVSPERYTNAFFGFSLPLPQDAPFRDLRLPSRDHRYSLFGLQAQRNGLTAFTITANQSSGASRDDVRKAASGPKGHSVKRIEVGGREFWKSESQEKGPAGKMRDVTYATGLNGYVLAFNIVSFDSKLTDDLQHSVESVTFFDPAKAGEIAGSSSHPYNPPTAVSRSPAVPSSARIGQLSLGVVSGNLYTNDALGFSYQFPQGWVIADKATQEKVTEAGHQFAWGNSSAAAREHEAAQQCTRILLWVTKYPEGTKTEEVNPLVALIAADPDCLPGFKFPSSIDDKENIKAAGQQILRSFGGTPFMARGQNSVRAFSVEGLDAGHFGFIGG
jgi:hypothetical protein